MIYICLTCFGSESLERLIEWSIREAMIGSTIICVGQTLDANEQDPSTGRIAKSNVKGWDYLCEREVQYRWGWEPVYIYRRVPVEVGSE